MYAAKPFRLYEISDGDDLVCYARPIAQSDYKKVDLEDLVEATVQRKRGDDVVTEKRIFVRESLVHEGQLVR